MMGANENYNFKVCILTAGYVQLYHTVTEPLRLPDVLYDLLYWGARNFIQVPKKLGLTWTVHGEENQEGHQLTDRMYS